MRQRGLFAWQIGAALPSCAEPTRVSEPKRGALLDPIHRHFCLTTTDGMKVQLAGLAPIHDRLHDIWCQPRQSKYLRDPARFQLQFAGEIRGIGNFARVK